MNPGAAPSGLELTYQAAFHLNPQILAQTAPRRYVVPQGFFDPRLVGGTLAEAIDIGGRGSHPHCDPVRATAYITTCRLLRYKVPTYFVGPELLAAVSASELPPDLLLQDLRWPLDGMLFMLPAGALISPSDGPCPFLAVGHYPPGTSDGFPGRDLFVGPSEALITVLTTAWNSTMFAGRELVEAGRTVADVVPDDQPYDFYTVAKGSHPAGELPENDKKFLRRVVGLALRLVMVMSARPELVERGGLARPAKKGKPELWAPNFLGKSYRIRHDAAAPGTHASPRLHWRRGHWRHQAVGPREVPGHKLLWIEPVLVAAGAPERDEGSEGSVGAARRG